MGLLYYYIVNQLSGDISDETIGIAEKIASLSQAGLFALIAVGLGYLCIWFYRREIKQYEARIRNSNKRVNELEKDVVKWQKRAFEAMNEHIVTLEDAKD